jgi:hypothetical protein
MKISELREGLNRLENATPCFLQAAQPDEIRLLIKALRRSEFTVFPPFSSGLRWAKMVMPLTAFMLVLAVGLLALRVLTI